MGKHIDQATKDRILAEVKEGRRVSEVAADESLNPKKIYYWLRGQADNTGTSTLEMNRLRRENSELKEIIGALTLAKSRGEKNRGRSYPSDPGHQ